MKPFNVFQDFTTLCFMPCGNPCSRSTLTKKIELADFLQYVYIYIYLFHDVAGFLKITISMH